MALTYFKRYRMEIDLTRGEFELPAFPAGYLGVPWRDTLLEAHAEAKYLSFRSELDANLFPCLAEREGCRRLMHEISKRDCFVPGATWLLAHQPEGVNGHDFCGTIQGLADENGGGSIQNVGIVSAHRGRGLGTCLLALALVGFQRAGLWRAHLEVTAQNTGAIRLYQRVGFRTVKTVYKAAEVAYA